MVQLVLLWCAELLIGGSMKIFFIMACTILLLGSNNIACAHNKASQSSKMSEKHKYDRSAVLNFAPGKSQLTQADMDALDNLVNNAGRGNVDRIEIAAWSDKEFPKTGNDLAKGDTDLADDRIDAIKDYVKNNLSVSSFKTFNMAETSNWLARTFRTDNAELKSVFSKDMSVPMAREDFNIIKNDGAPSKAVIVAVQKTDKTTSSGSNDYNRNTVNTNSGSLDTDKSGRSSNVPNGTSSDNTSDTSKTPESSNY
jgi:hypothetical protein